MVGVSAQGQGRPGRAGRATREAAVVAAAAAAATATVRKGVQRVRVQPRENMTSRESGG